MQAAFTEALRYATQPGFDVEVINLLLNHGARPAGLWGPGLFEDGRLNEPGGVYDDFGLIEKLRARDRDRADFDRLVGDGNGTIQVSDLDAS